MYYDSNIYDNYDTTLSVQEESGLHKGLFTPSFNGSVNVNTCMDFIDLYLHHSHQASAVMPALTLENADAQSEQGLYISRLLNLEYKQNITTIPHFSRSSETKIYKYTELG